MKKPGRKSSYRKKPAEAVDDGSVWTGLPVAIWRVTGKSGKHLYFRSKNGVVLPTSDKPLAELDGLPLKAAWAVCHRNGWTVTLMPEEKAEPIGADGMSEDVTRLAELIAERT